MLNAVMHIPKTENITKIWNKNKIYKNKPQKTPCLIITTILIYYERENNKKKYKMLLMRG